MFLPLLRNVALTLATLTITAAAQAEVGVFANGIPGPAYNKVVELKTAGHNVKKVAFVPGGGWIVLYDDNGYYAQSVPTGAVTKLDEYNASGTTVNSIAFTQDRGWVILAGTNDYWYNNIPQGLIDGLAALRAAGKALNDVTFSPGNTFVLLGDRGSVSWGAGIDRDLYNKLQELLVNTDTNFRMIAISPTDASKWVLMYNNELYYHNLDNTFITKFNEITNDGSFPLTFSYANDGSGVWIW